MPLLQDPYQYDPRRFIVVADRLAIYSGVYKKGEVITESQSGSATDQLLEMGKLREVDYDLRLLRFWVTGAPEAI